MPAIILILCLFSMTCFGQAFNLRDLALVGKIATPAGGGNEIADTFIHPNGTALTNTTTSTGGYAWIASSANSPFVWYITNNMAFLNNGLAHGAYVNHVMSSPDYTATIGVRDDGVDANEISIGIRGNIPSTAVSTPAPTNGYFITWGPGSFLRLDVKTNNTATTLFSASSAAIGTIGTLTISASGTTISCKTNGVLMKSLTEASIAGAGVVWIGPGWRGGGGQNTMYSNLIVTVP